MTKIKFSSIAIPNTTRHIAFINEVKAVLKASTIPYKTEILEDYVGQSSKVHFYTKTQKACDHVAALAEMVSRREDTLKSLGEKFKTKWNS